MKNNKNVALIGVGRWGKNLLREFSKIASVDYCYYQGNQKTSDWLASNYPNIKRVDSYDDILKNPVIDAVVIATPIRTHFELAKLALGAGKNVFVEKPISETPEQAQELIDLADKKKLMLFVGYTFIYHPIFQKIKDIISEEGAEYIKMQWEKFGHFGENIELNLLCHEFSIIYSLLGRPLKITELKRRKIISEADIISIQAKYPKTTVDIDINRASLIKRKTLYLVTEKNTYLWETSTLFKLDQGSKEFVKIFESADTPLELECIEFIKCLSESKKPKTDGEFGLEINNLLTKMVKLKTF